MGVAGGGADTAPAGGEDVPAVVDGGVDAAGVKSAEEEDAAGVDCDDEEAVGTDGEEDAASGCPTGKSSNRLSLSFARCLLISPRAILYSFERLVTC